MKNTLTTYRPTFCRSLRNLSSAEDYNSQYLSQHLLEIFKQASKRPIGNWNHCFFSDSKKDLASATLRSIALNYIAIRDPKPPRALLQAINNLKRREGVIITKPDKGSSVLVMDKTDYLRLLCDASIQDTAKFINRAAVGVRGSSFARVFFFLTAQP